MPGSRAETRGLDHRPLDEGDATPLSLRLLGMYLELDPELAVRRTPLALPSQLRYEASRASGESPGVTAPDELPVKRRL
jgi:hypothetical protein